MILPFKKSVLKLPDPFPSPFTTARGTRCLRIPARGQNQSAAVGNCKWFIKKERKGLCLGMNLCVLQCSRALRCRKRVSCPGTVHDCCSMAWHQPSALNSNRSSPGGCWMRWEGTCCSPGTAPAAPQSQGGVGAAHGADLRTAMTRELKYNPLQTARARAACAQPAAPGGAGFGPRAARGQQKAPGSCR